MEEHVMSETQAETTTTEVVAATTTETQGDPAELGEAGKKAIKAERARASAAEKAAATLQAKLNEIEAANLSELERAQKQAKDAADRLSEYEKTTLRQQVALEKGLPAKWVSRLKGDTVEELAADADEILADLKTDTTTPRPDLTQGGSGTATALNSDGLEQALRDKLGI